MNAGKLRHRVTIENRADGKDSYGQPSGEWQSLATVSASIEPLQGRELFDAQKISALVTHKVGMRYIAGVTPKSRIKFDTRVFQVEAVINPEERKRELSLLCTEVI